MAFKIGSYVYSSIVNKKILSDLYRINISKCGYAYFPPEYRKAIVSPKVLNELEESSEIDELKFQLFLPAQISDNSSVFYDHTFERFVNYIMTGGNKNIARKLMERTFYEIKKTQLTKCNNAESEAERANIECNPLTILHTAIKNCQPILTVIPVKRGALVYQVPVPLSEKRSDYLSIKWLLEAGRDKDLKTHLSIKLSKELIDAYHKEGRVIKKKQDLHRLCEANRAYAHFRWG